MASLGTATSSTYQEVAAPEPSQEPSPGEVPIEEEFEIVQFVRPPEPLAGATLELGAEAVEVSSCEVSGGPEPGGARDRSTSSSSCEAPAAEEPAATFVAATFVAAALDRASQALAAEASTAGAPVEERSSAEAAERLAAAAGAAPEPPEEPPLCELPPLPRRAKGYYTEPLCGVSLVSAMAAGCLLSVRAVTWGGERRPNLWQRSLAGAVELWVGVAGSSLLFVLLARAGELGRSEARCRGMPQEVARALRTQGVVPEDSWELQRALQTREDGSTYCVRCLMWRPANSHHCSTCQRCVSDFDHHCAVLGRCITGGNLKCFYALLAAAGGGIPTTFLALISDSRPKVVLRRLALLSLASALLAAAALTALARSGPFVQIFFAGAADGFTENLQNIFCCFRCQRSRSGSRATAALPGLP